MAKEGEVMKKWHSPDETIEAQGKENADLREQLEEKNTQLAKLMGSAAGSYLALQEQRDEARNEAGKYYRLWKKKDESLKKVAERNMHQMIVNWSYNGQVYDLKDELKKAQERIAELEEDIRKTLFTIGQFQHKYKFHSSFEINTELLSKWLAPLVNALQRKQ